MKHIKVAIFTGNYNHIRDGVSLTLNRLVQYLLEQGVDVLVFGPTIDEPEIEHAGTLVDVPSVAMPGRPEYRATISFPKSARKKLKDFNPDIIHIATPDVLGFKALRWAKQNNKPVVASYHTHFSSYLKYYKLTFLESLMWKYLAWFYSNCKQVYVPSPSMAQELNKKDINSDLRIWARGIETSDFNPELRSVEWRKKFGFEKSDIVVAFVSRLVWEKNLDLFSAVMRQIMNEYNNVKTLIVGDGPAAEELKEKFPEAIYTGFLNGEELSKSYASSDIFFFPSDTETFGNVTLEAMASGLPCVVADATGSRSLIEQNTNGFLASVNKPGEFKRAIIKLVENEQLRKKMGKQSHKKAKNFSWDSINSKLLSNYNNVLEAND